MTERSEHLALGDVVRELVRGYVAADWPANHVCSPACTHDGYASISLVDRLRDVVMPGTTPRDASGIRSGGVNGSPAPWDPRAGELLDEIARGALEHSRNLRLMLGLSPLRIKSVTRPPGWHPPMRQHVVSALADFMPLDAALEPALDDVVARYPLVQARHPEHWLVRGEQLSKTKPEHGHLPGAVESSLRRWHRNALVVLGFQSPPVVLRQIANPEYGRFLPGPLCEHCRHESCIQVSLSRQSLWITARCPYCNAKGIHQNPETGTLFCARPSCRDEEGRPHSWSLDALRRLGLVMLSETNA